ncbi:MAG: SOS response-associated peptidase [Desulfobacterales bacterium]|nr:MAG: SOS response-associated peptidase [Desulfobacterales bacterium]UCD89958.1 MAG: SOS response-associated peptidase [Desulfobacterales bacterium]
MCGRFVGFRSLEELKQFFPIAHANCEVTENYNVAPSQKVLAIIQQSNVNRLEKLHWGLVPFWANDTAIGNRMINARAETVAEKPSFRNAFRKRRCLILADGFFEWRGKKGSKRPIFITLPDKNPFAFAGLWETWHAKDADESIYKSCAIITTEASGSIREIHYRMPTVLKPETYEFWLDPANQNVKELNHILTIGIVTEFVSHPVSKQVNSVKNNAPDNINPV